MDKIAPTSDGIPAVPRANSFRWGRVDVASRFRRAFTAWAAVLPRPGVLAIGPYFSPLVEQTPDRRRSRRHPWSGPRGRRRLVLLLAVVHGRGLPPRSARAIQPQAPRR